MNKNFLGKRKDKVNKFSNCIHRHIENNKKGYILAIILFLVGILASIIFINNCNDSQKNEIKNYIEMIIVNLKESSSIDYLSILLDSIKINTIIVIIVTISSLIIIGRPVIYLLIISKGFIFGYTVGSIIYALGISNGLITSFSGLLIHNIVFLPIFFALCVRGLGIYSEIIKNKKIFKIELFRYLIFLLFILCLFFLSSLVEVFISDNLLISVIKYLNI